MATPPFKSYPRRSRGRAKGRSVLAGLIYMPLRPSKPSERANRESHRRTARSSAHHTERDEGNREVRRGGSARRNRALDRATGASVTARARSHGPQGESAVPCRRRTTRSRTTRPSRLRNGRQSDARDDKYDIVSSRRTGQNNYFPVIGDKTDGRDDVKIVEFANEGDPSDDYGIVWAELV